jgi:hypothetical protein
VRKEKRQPELRPLCDAQKIGIVLLRRAKPQGRRRPFFVNWTEHMSENPLFAAFFAGFKTARQRERFSHTIFRALEARNECAMQGIGGGSADTPAPARAPRRTRTTSRKPSTGDGGDSDGEPAPRYTLSATSHEGFAIQTADGKPARLCVVAQDGEILSDDVCGDAFRVAVAAYRNFLQGTGHLKVHASAPGLAKA